ncbi:MAG: hypothetical protein VZQ47_00740 [Treponema sp.]|nr:hypothetical protein [Treponema sp.]MEE3434069.1 hypothetical protein [Treponema sp.]
MNVYENAATEAIRSFFDNEPRWKKEILFNFLLEPFNLNLDEIEYIETQDYLKETIPDFIIKTKNNGSIKFEVKINNAALTDSERKKSSRDVFLLPKGYIHNKKIPKSCKRLFWEDLFELIERKGAMQEFARLGLIQEYLHEPEYILLLKPMEVAMLYSPETVFAVYELSEIVLNLCKNFLDENTGKYTKPKKEQNQWGIGYYFYKGKQKLFIGISPQYSKEKEDYSFSIALKINNKNDNFGKKYENICDGWSFFPLDKTILAKYSSEKDLQEAFNKNAEEALKKIFPAKK